MDEEIRDVAQDINVLALVKGSERYIFLFDDDHRSDALRTLGRFASNPDLSFTWYDAAVLESEDSPDGGTHASFLAFYVSLGQRQVGRRRDVIRHANRDIAVSEIPERRAQRFPV